MKLNSLAIVVLTLFLVICPGCDSRSATSAGPESANPRDAVVVTALLAEDWPAVVSAIRADPQEAQAVTRRAVLGHALLALNQNNESVALLASITSTEDREGWNSWCETLARDHVQNVVAQYLLADSLARLGRKAEALDAFDRSLKLKSDFGLGLNGKGVLLAQMGRKEEALKALRQASSGSPPLADAFASLGACQYQCRMDGAIQSYHEALTCSKDYALAMNGLACVLFGVGKGSDSAAGDGTMVSEAAQLLVAAGRDPFAQPLVAMNLKAIVNEASSVLSEATTKPGTFAKMNMDQLSQMDSALKAKLTTIGNFQTGVNLANNQLALGPLGTYGTDLGGMKDQLAVIRNQTQQQLEKVQQTMQSLAPNIPAPAGVSHSVPGGATSAQPARTAISSGDWTLNVAYGLSFVPLPTRSQPATSPIARQGL